VKIEASLDICGQITPLGCGAWASLGSWHPDPSNCGGGEIANTASAQLLKSGWVDLCVDSDRFPATDPTTLQDKALFGYQGWFKAAGDGSGDHWHHWFSGKPANASNATFDLWPDLSEFGSDELFATNMSYPDGSTAKVFSSYKTQTVRRHFKWMAETGIDGVFLQRFLSELKDFNQFSFRNKVTDNVCAGATEHGRAFAIMYDISGADPETFVEDLKVDWAYLVEQQGVTGSPAYLRHEGKPVLAIWGPGFHDRPGTAAETLSLINYLQNEAPVHLRAYVVGGVPYHWRTSDGDSKPGFSEVYAHYDAISPWSVGRYADQTAFSSNFNATVLPDKNYVAQIGSDYAPVAWPGFSWANLKKTPGSFNQIPRQGGQFFWHQVRKLYEINPLFLYVAMFDEVDEATAMFKAVTAADKVPVNGTWLHLGEDGWALPSDWYLRLGGAAAKAMQKQFVPQGSLPYQPTP